MHQEVEPRVLAKGVFRHAEDVVCACKNCDENSGYRDDLFAKVEEHTKDQQVSEAAKPRGMNPNRTIHDGNPDERRHADPFSRGIGCSRERERQPDDSGSGNQNKKPLAERDILRKSFAKDHHKHLLRLGFGIGLNPSPAGVSNERGANRHSKRD